MEEIGNKLIYWHIDKILLQDVAMETKEFVFVMDQKLIKERKQIVAIILIFGGEKD